MDTQPTPTVPPARRRPWLRSLPVALVAAVALVGAACSSDDGGEDADATTTTTTSTTVPGVPQVDGGPDDAAFRGPGPYEVGVTTLQLPDRAVEVWYPAEDGSTEGLEPASYSQLEALPPSLAAAAPALLPADVPPEVLDVEMTDTYRDVPASTEGPFPLVLFSHGFGSFRLDASAVVRGIASWGFVVAAPDHIERNRAALLTNTVTRAPEQDVAVLVDTITLVGDAGGVLEGLTNTDDVAAVGHSAGGRAVLSALSEPEIDVAVGWAAAGRADVPAPDKPSMNIAAKVDVLVPLEEIEQTYAGMNPPKRLVVIDGAGHNSFTDICLPVKNGTDLIGLAQRIGFPIPENLAAGGRDGCEEGSIDTEAGWEITQHFTVAEIRDAFGVDDGTGLGEAVTEEFDVPIDYRQDLG